MTTSDSRIEPFAASMKDWETIDARQRAAHPVWYFVHKRIPRKWRRFCHLCREAYWAIRHRVDPRHRYHIVRTGLSPGYYDIDTRMFESAFWLFSQYCKYNSEWIDYDSSKDTERPMGDEHHDYWENVRQEVRALREWWTVTRPARNTDWFIPGMPEEESRAGFAQEDDWESEDQDMYLRLAKIRRGLWT